MPACKVQERQYRVISWMRMAQGHPGGSQQNMGLSCTGLWETGARSARDAKHTVCLGSRPPLCFAFFTRTMTLLPRSHHHAGHRGQAIFSTCSAWPSSHAVARPWRLTDRRGCSGADWAAEAMCHRFVTSYGSKRAQPKVA